MRFLLRFTHTDKRHRNSSKRYRTPIRRKYFYSLAHHTGLETRDYIVHNPFNNTILKFTSSNKQPSTVINQRVNHCHRGDNLSAATARPGKMSTTCCKRNIYNITSAPLYICDYAHCRYHTLDCDCKTCLVSESATRSSNLRIRTD